jgi:hypothetical protein
MAACVLADPPAGLPTAPIEPPIIEREYVVPPELLLQKLPTEFIVPVEVDPRKSSILSDLIIDGTVAAKSQQLILTDGGAIVQVDDVPAAVANAGRNQGNLTPGESAAECHTLTISIAYSDLSASDSITWLYSPTGGFTGCPVFDAGPQGAGDGATDGNLGGGG